MIKVLFVCTGNICRSPTAEGVFRHLVQAEDLAAQFHIDSAGTDSYHVGDAPDKRAVKVASQHGVSLTGLKARALKVTDFNDFDYLYAMDGGHLFELQQRAPAGSSAQLELFMTAANTSQNDVPDPWYGTEQDFENVFALVQQGADAILQKIRQEHSL